MGVILMAPIDIAYYSLEKASLRSPVPVFVTILDVICCFDIALKFFTGYIDTEAYKIVLEPQKIRRYNIRSFFKNISQSEQVF